MVACLLTINEGGIVEPGPEVYGFCFLLSMGNSGVQQSLPMEMIMNNRTRLRITHKIKTTQNTKLNIKIIV